MDIFQERIDLQIGRILEVNGISIRIEIDGSITELTKAIDGRVYGVGQLGSVIKIHYGRILLFAYVRMLRMRSEIALIEGSNRISPDDDSRILEADLFAQATWNSGSGNLKLMRGIEVYPLPLQCAYITTSSELEQFYRAAEITAEDGTNTPLVPIGNYIGGNGAICRANIDKLFGQHCAVLGSTGAGKSGTVAALIHSVLAHHDSAGVALNPNIIVIDPHGEYVASFGDRATVYRAYNSIAAGEQALPELRMPYWLMSGDEVRGLVIGKTPEEATSQNNIVYKALKHARMVGAGIVEPLPENVVGGYESNLCAGKTVEDVGSFNRDWPVFFSLNEFRRHIDEVQGRKATVVAAMSNTDRKPHDSILDKLAVLQHDPRLRFMMKERNDETLTNIVAQLTHVDAGASCIKVIDISGLPNEVAGPLTAVISRVLFQFKVWQTREQREKNPMLLVCEEAHRYVPDRGEAQYRDAQDAIRRIAKEGRKYGLGLMLVSQRPADVEGTVLSQCNSWIVLRLTNSRDQEHVSKFLPDNLAGLTRLLPSLARREAIFVGEAAALPARIRVRELTTAQLPKSSDIAFASGWASDGLNLDAVAAITARWAGT